MGRALSVWLPTFATDLVKRKLDREQAGVLGKHGHGPHSTIPFIVLTRVIAGRELVARCCANSTRRGLMEGMDVAQARSFLPSRARLVMHAHEPARDAAALHTLACWALRYTPLAAPDGDDGILLDMRGTERVHKDGAHLVRKVASGLRRLGFATRVAGAATFACAWAVARFGQERLTSVAEGSEAIALADLPVAALHTDEETIAALAEVGIDTIRELQALPRHGVAARYGTEVLEHLDQALGRAAAPRSITPVQPKPALQSSLEFDGPTDHAESVHAAARRVLTDLVTQLKHAQRGVRKLKMTLNRPHGAPECVEVLLSCPSASVNHIWKLVEVRLERADIGRGVDGITMVAAQTARTRHQQTSSPALGARNAAAHDTALGELVDTLIERLRSDNITRGCLVQSYIPERAYRYVPAIERLPSVETVATHPCSDRPALLYQSPEPAGVVSLTPDGPLLSLLWRGRQHVITGCSGPEYVSAEWWHAGARHAGMAGVPPDRAYYAAQTEEGRWLFVCRQVGTPNWFVHGEWA